jgi:ribokinase
MPTDKTKICVVGSANVDLIFRTQRLPQPGETFAGKSFQLCFGGKGANQAVTAARMGADVAMVARVGYDLFGEQSLQNFREQGIDVAHVVCDDQRSTGVASIAVDDGGQNCIIVVPGANEALTAENVRRAGDMIAEASVLVCQLETPIEATLEAFRLARATDVLTILNPAPARELPPELLQLTDLLVPNEPELSFLAGRVIQGIEDAKTAARQLLAWGPRTVIATLGERGALIVEAEAADYVRAATVKAVDTTGAGDVFIGTLATLLGEARPLHDAVKWANAAAALSVTRPGTQTSFPHRDEVERFWITFYESASQRTD